MIDVTAPVKRTHDGVRCHVVKALPAQDRTIIDAIPVTTWSGRCSTTRRSRSRVS